MRIDIVPDKATLGVRAAAQGAQAIRAALAVRGECTIVVATGASQFEMLDALVTEPGIGWSGVTAFHLDEYVGSAGHARRKLPTVSSGALRRTGCRGCGPSFP